MWFSEVCASHGGACQWQWWGHLYPLILLLAAWKLEGASKTRRSYGVKCLPKAFYPFLSAGCCFPQRGISPPPVYWLSWLLFPQCTLNCAAGGEADPRICVQWGGGRGAFLATCISWLPWRLLPWYALSSAAGGEAAPRIPMQSSFHGISSLQGGCSATSQISQNEPVW